MKLTLIDNYDSFTYNLAHYFGQLGADVTVCRNDAISAEQVMKEKPDAIALSPGPGTPEESGICMDLIGLAKDKIPLLGVCLGHQAIGHVFGGKIRREKPMHGKLSRIDHEGGGVFYGINGSFLATRYHSLVVDRQALPDELEVTAQTEDGLIMGLSHRLYPVHGVQFHPESIASEHGHRIMQNFLDLARQFNTRAHQAS